MQVLAIGAHPDDIELGCGGALAVHAEAGDAIAMLVMTAGERGPHEGTRIHEQEDAARLYGAELFWGGLEDGAIAEGRDTIAVIETVIARVRPDVIYTHAPADSHQDHRGVALATLSAGRRHSRICQYESPTTTRFDPTIYVDISTAVERKLDALRAHTSQILRNYFVDLDAVVATARYRGFQSRIDHAEAFETPRFMWSITSARGHRPLTQEGVAALDDTHTSHTTERILL